MFRLVFVSTGGVLLGIYCKFNMFTRFARKMREIQENHDKHWKMQEGNAENIPKYTEYIYIYAERFGKQREILANLVKMLKHTVS